MAKQGDSVAVLKIAGMCIAAGIALYIILGWIFWRTSYVLTTCCFLDVLLPPSASIFDTLAGPRFVSNIHDLILSCYSMALGCFRLMDRICASLDRNMAWHDDLQCMLWPEISPSSSLYSVCYFWAVPVIDIDVQDRRRRDSYRLLWPTSVVPSPLGSLDWRLHDLQICPSGSYILFGTAGSKPHCDLTFLLLPIFHVINTVITEHNTYLAH